MDKQLIFDLIEIIAKSLSRHYSEFLKEGEELIIQKEKYVHGSTQ